MFENSVDRSISDGNQTMTSTTTSSQRMPTDNRYYSNERYKTAIVLNNAAIALLERNECYKDAIEMFRAALYTIQLSFCSMGNYDTDIILSEHTHVSDTEIHHRLRKASKSKQQQQQQQQQHNQSPDTTPATNQCPSCTESFVAIKFSTQQSPTMVGPNIDRASNNGTNLVFSYIYIEPIDHDDIDLNSIYRDSMMILYNFGVAHFALGQQLQSNASSFPSHSNNPTQQQQQQQQPVSALHRWMVAQELHGSAYQIFQLIEVYVRQRLSYEQQRQVQRMEQHHRLGGGAGSIGCGSIPPTSSSDHVMLLFSALFIYTMSELAYQLNDTAIHEYYTLAYSAILLLIEAQDKSLPPMTVQAGAA